MKAREDGKVNWEDIQLVQKLIERCLELYMTQVRAPLLLAVLLAVLVLLLQLLLVLLPLLLVLLLQLLLVLLPLLLALPPPPLPPLPLTPRPALQAEIVTALKMQANIEPGFTQLVWEKLAEQNSPFFDAYAMRVRVKKQMREFNSLVQQQNALLTRATGAPRIAPPERRMAASGASAVAAGMPVGHAQREARTKQAAALKAQQQGQEAAAAAGERAQKQARAKRLRQEKSGGGGSGSGAWHAAVSDDADTKGKLYWYHTQSRVTTWQRPEGAPANPSQNPPRAPKATQQPIAVKTVAVVATAVESDGAPPASPASGGPQRVAVEASPVPPSPTGGGKKQKGAAPSRASPTGAGEPGAVAGGAGGEEGAAAPARRSSRRR